MAERRVVELVDDIDGSPAEHTVTFGLDGVSYQIDLNEPHAERLRSVLAPYIKIAENKRREAEAQRKRQENQHLTAAIRGAAQRSRQQAKDSTPSRPTSKPEPAEEPEQPTFEPPAAAVSPRPAPAPTATPPVPIPQFSAATN